MHAHCGSSLGLRSSHSHPHVSCARWVISSTYPFISSPYLFISFIFLLFLLPYTFYFLDVVDKFPAYFRWGLWHPPPQRTRPPQVMSPTTTSSQRLCRIHPWVLGRATVPCWFRLWWRHHRQDAAWRVPKTSRSLSRRRFVALSVVVRQSC